MNDVNIIDALIVRPEGKFKGSVGIKDGIIVNISENKDEIGSAGATVNGENKILLPGMIDSHVHIRGGRFSHREDFGTGTMAAAAGGVTTIMEMPVCDPPASRKENFLRRKAEIEKEAYVDFCLYGGAGADNTDEITQLAEVGAIAFKTFLMPPVKGREKEFYGLCSQDYAELVRVMEEVEKTGCMLAVHSELNEYVGANTEEAIKAGKDGLTAFCESRPEIAEIEGVRRVIDASRQTKCRASICHVSTAEAAMLIYDARKDGVEIHGETCPQYLLFDKHTAAHAGVFARIKPPYRERDNVERLLELYGRGYLEITGSDHAPYLYEEKVKNGNSIWETFDGLPSIELSLRLLLNEVEKGRLTLEKIVRNTSENTAKLFKIYPRKGRIEVGADADLVLISKLSEPEPVVLEKLFTKSRQSAVLFENIPLHYRIDETYVRGKKVFSGGKITGEKGWGKFTVSGNRNLIKNRR